MQALATDIRSAVTEEIAAMFLHDLRPAVGQIRLVAAREFPNWATSDTLRQVDHVSELLESFASLAVAGRVRAWTEFDLSVLVSEVVQSIDVTGDSRIATAGPASLMVRGDSSLVRLAVVNGLRNAVEAGASVADNRIVVAWGDTDRDYWVTILDRGVGLALPPRRALTLGATTKSSSGQRGLGLSIASRAAQSLGGSIELADRSPEGARFELRWPATFISP
jgi:signal transduction histidine kinase